MVPPLIFLKGNPRTLLMGFFILLNHNGNLNEIYSNCICKWNYVQLFKENLIYQVQLKDKHFLFYILI